MCDHGGVKPRSDRERYYGTRYDRERYYGTADMRMAGLMRGGWLGYVCANGWGMSVRMAVDSVYGEECSAGSVFVKNSHFFIIPSLKKRKKVVF